MATIPPIIPGYSAGPQRGGGEPANVPLQNAGTAADAASAATNVADPLLAALGAALTSAAARQNGLALVFADLEALLSRPGVPPPVREAGEALLALRLDPGAITAATLAKALAQSGLFLEAALAAQRSVPADIKLALLKLRHSLQGWLGDIPDGAELPAGSAPPPPYRGGQPAAQPPIAALPSRGAIGEVAGLLQAAVGAALARHTMLQIASLPDASGPAQQHNIAPALLFDVPLLTPQGTAVVQFQVSRDGGQGHTADRGERPGWRVNFSVNLEPIGPVHARIAQTGERTHVALRAERPDSARALHGGLPTLRHMLTQAALVPGDVTCMAGIPAPPATAPGLFLDRAT